MAERRREDPWSDPSAADAHRRPGAARRCGRRRGRRGGRGGGHPGHGGPLVRGLLGAALGAHAHFLPRIIRLPHVVGGRLPGHQLSLWHVLPPVPHAELTQECRTLYFIFFKYCIEKDCKMEVHSFRKDKTTDSLHLVFWFAERRRAAATLCYRILV